MRFIWAISVVFLLCECSFGQQSKEQAEIAAQLKKYQHAIPTSDLQKTWAKGDFRFIGVYGISLDTPGIRRGHDGGLIHLVGINPIEGTSDGISSEAQLKLDEVAYRYAKEYNMALLQKLKASKNSEPHLIHLFQQIEEELLLLEKSDPKIDLARNIKKKDFAFIYLQETGIEGVADKEFDEIIDYHLKLRDLKSSKDLLTRSQYPRYRRIAMNYVRPYNKMLFDYLMKRNKKPQK